MTAAGLPALHAADDTTRNYDSWNLRCQSAAPSSTGADAIGDDRQCFIFQNLVLKQGGQRVFNMAVGFVAESSDPIALVTLPLGISLPPGAALKVNGHDAVTFPIERCMPAGCRAGVRLSPEMVAQLESGEDAVVTFYDSTRQPVSVNLSLAGFAPALAALSAARPR